MPFKSTLAPVFTFLLLVSTAQASPLHQALELQGPVSRVEISYLEDLQSVQDASYEEIVFQKNGLGAVHTIYQPIGFEHVVTTYSWDPRKRILTVRRVEDNQKYGTWVSQFDQQGCELKTKFFPARDALRRTTVRTCEPDGRVLREKDYTQYERYPQVLNFSNEQQGGALLVRSARPDHAPFADYTLYNNKNLAIEIGLFTADEKNPMYRYVYQYDQRGNWTTRTTYGWIAEEGVWGKATVQVARRTIHYF